MNFPLACWGANVPQSQNSSQTDRVRTGRAALGGGGKTEAGKLLRQNAKFRQLNVKHFKLN